MGSAMTNVDFTGQEFFRDPSASIAALGIGTGRRDQIADRRQGVDHHDI